MDEYANAGAQGGSFGATRGGRCPREKRQGDGLPRGGGQTDRGEGEVSGERRPSYHERDGNCFCFLSSRFFCLCCLYVLGSDIDY